MLGQRVRFQARKKGFTLLETVVAIAVLGLVAIAVGRVYLASQRSVRRQKAERTALGDAQWALELISNELRHSANAFVFGGGRRLRFIIDSNGNNIDDTTVTYERLTGANSNRLVRRSIMLVNSPNRNVTIYMVDNPSGNDIFTRNPVTGTITIEITLNYRPDMTDPSDNLTLRTTVGWRN